MTEPWLAMILEGVGDYEFVDVTSFGGPTQTLIGSCGPDRATATARILYLDGRINVEQFERALDAIAEASRA